VRLDLRTRTNAAGGLMRHESAHTLGWCVQRGRCSCARFRAWSFTPHHLRAAASRAARASAPALNAGGDNSARPRKGLSLAVTQNTTTQQRQRTEETHSCIMITPGAPDGPVT
jgi:hypothetical protein